MKDQNPDKLISNRYVHMMKDELRQRLKREPTLDERLNGDTDSDLVLELYWKLILELDARIVTLEDQVDNLINPTKNGVV